MTREKLIMNIGLGLWALLVSKISLRCERPLRSGEEKRILPVEVKVVGSRYRGAKEVER